MTKLKQDLFSENYKPQGRIGGLLREIEYLSGLVYEYRNLPLTEIARKRQILWDRLEFKFHSGGTFHKQCDVCPNDLGGSAKELLLSMLIEKGYARINKSNYTEQESISKSYWTTYLKTPQGYEFSIGQNSSSFANSCIFELAAQVLTVDEINKI